MTTTEMFKEFASSLNDQADQRERIVKISREITLNSKRAIFTLQRLGGMQSSHADKRAKIFTEATDKFEQIRLLFVALSEQVSPSDFWKHRRSITGGVQEYVEAVSFHHFLVHEQNAPDKALITLSELVANYGLVDADGVQVINLSVEDYVLGIADLTGELMRYCINSSGVSGTTTVTSQLICYLLRTLESQIDALESVYYINELNKKLQVLRQSLAKVEQVCYNVRILQSEYPPEMLKQMLDNIGASSDFMNE